LTPARKRKN